MLNELRPHTPEFETNKAVFVPMKRESPSLHREEFGGLTWFPNYVLYANQLEIDVAAANQIFRAINLQYPVVISSYTPPHEIPVVNIPLDNSHSRAQALAISAADTRQQKEKKNTS